MFGGKEVRKPMRQNLLARLVAAGVLCLFCPAIFVGCLRSAPPPLPQSFKGFADPDALFWPFDSEKKQGRVPGIDDAHIAYLQWCDDVSHQENARMALVVWTDLTDQSFSGPSFPPRSEGEVGQFNFHLGENERLVIKCQTADGRNGSVSVNGKEFDLARGWLVLVSTKSGKVRTKQVQRDGIKQTPKQGLQEYEKLRSDPDLVAFFATEK
jgi:hypothetical protein